MEQEFKQQDVMEFGLSYQPGFKEFPVAKYKQSYFSGVDWYKDGTFSRISTFCIDFFDYSFHPNKCANQLMSILLWNVSFLKNILLTIAQLILLINRICFRIKRKKARNMILSRWNLYVQILKSHIFNEGKENLYCALFALRFTDMVYQISFVKHILYNKKKKISI